MSILDFTTTTLVSQTAFLVLIIILFVAAGPLIRRTRHGEDHSGRSRAARAICILAALTFISSALVSGAQVQFGIILQKIAYSLIVFYIALIAYQIGSYFSHVRFGKKKDLDTKDLKTKVIYVETYSSRLINIILVALLSLFTLYVLLQVWGANSQLESTGIIGIILAFLAFTSGQWAPDLLSGLTILNANSIEDGDVVVIDGFEDEYIINKVSFIYTILYDIRNNNRTLMRNSRVLQGRIDNLSRIASTDGIRYALKYNIGYPKVAGANRQDRREEVLAFTRSVNDLCQSVFEQACEDDRIHINPNKPFEIALTNTGDYALEYTLWYFLDRLPATKVTSRIRGHLIGTRNRLNELVFIEATAAGIDLSTPDLSVMTVVSEGQGGAGLTA